jgi:hypothetical protein
VRERGKIIAERLGRLRQGGEEGRSRGRRKGRGRTPWGKHNMEEEGEHKRKILLTEMS